MIENVNTNQTQNLLENSSSSQPSSPKTLPDNGLDASLQVDYASLIDKASQINQTDTNAVQQAKELLASGRLESPQNFQEAAENIIKFGI
jgi:hypothetical protein